MVALNCDSDGFQILVLLASLVILAIQENLVILVIPKNVVILVNLVSLTFLVHLVFLVNLYSDSLESSDSGEWGVSG